MPCKLFVGGISAHTTTEALKVHFSQYGRLIDAVVMSKNGRPRGFGFVTFDSPAPAVTALSEPQWLDGRLVDVKRAVPGERPQERSSNKIFVGGLPQEITTDDLKSYFGGYGAVADAVVMVDRRTNRSRGFGFVRFCNGTQGSAAAEAVLLDFGSHRLRGKWVEVKPATPAALLQELGDADGDCGAEAFSDQCMYMVDPNCGGWDASWGMLGDDSLGGRSHVRGRRGRRRRSGTGNGGGEEDLLIDEEDLLSSGAGSSGGSAHADPMISALAGAFGPAMTSYMSTQSSTPSLGEWGEAHSAPGSRRASLSSLARAFSPVAVEPRVCCSGSLKSMKLPDVDAGWASSPALSCQGSKESDADEPDTLKVSTQPPLLALDLLPPGLENLPMKVACREDCNENGPDKDDQAGQLEGFKCFTREDFLSLEVRPWLSAC